MPGVKDKGFDINAVLKTMGFGYAFANPFTTSYLKDPKHAYRSAWDCFDKMIAWDGELAAIDNLYRQAVLAHDTSVEPADKVPESKEAAEFIRAVIGRIGNWTDVKEDLLDGRAKGLAIALVGREGYDDELGGKLAPKTIEILPQNWFRFKLGDSGPELVYAGTGNVAKELDESRFIIARFGHTIENPYGYGYLRKAFFPFVVRNLLGGFMHQLFEYGVEPQMWAELSEEDWATKEDILDKMEEMGRRTVTVYPSGTKINVIPANTVAINAELTVIRYYADIQAKIVLGQTLTTDVGRTGSYELGKIHELQQARLVVAGCRWLERIVNKQFVEPLCALNFGAGRAKWRIMYEPQRDVAGLIDNITKLANKYNLRLVEEWIYRLLDAPIPTEGGQGVVEPVAAPAPAFVAPAEGRKTTAGGLKPEQLLRRPLSAAALTPQRLGIQDKNRILGRQVQRNVRLSKPAVEGRLDFFRGMIDQAKSYEGLRAELDGHDSDWPELADQMRKGVVTQYALAMYTQGIRMHSRRRKSMALAGAEFNDWDDVVKTFGKKIPIDPDVFYDLDTKLRAKYWTAAKIEDLRVTDRIMASMAGAMDEGRTLTDFKASAYETMRTAGYEFPEPYRLENVFRTNLSIADSAGKEDWYSQPDVQELVQGWEWATSQADNVCEECAALEGKQWLKDEPRPHEPLHNQCDCNTFAILVDEPFKGGGSEVNWQSFKGVKEGFGGDPRDMLRATP